MAIKKHGMKKAVAYLRVSGEKQIGGHGFDRQEKAIRGYAEGNGMLLEKIYKEKAVSGTKDQEDRPAFKEMVSDLLSNGTRTIIIESMDRLARELRVQENLCVYLALKELQLISANTGEDITQAIQEDPMKKALIQIQGVFSELDKNMIVKRLRKGRQSAKAVNKQRGRSLTLKGDGKCEGRKSYQETHQELIKAAKKLYRKPRNGERRSLLKLSALLFEMGYRTAKGKAFSGSQIQRLVG